MSRKGKWAKGASPAVSQPAALRPRRRGLFLWGGALAFIAGVVVYSLLATGSLGGQMANADIAPDVTLTTAEGQVRLSDLRGQPVLLYFSFSG